MAATRRLRVRTAGAALAAGALLTAGCAGSSGLSPAAATGESSAPASESSSATPSEAPSATPSEAPSATPSEAPSPSPSATPAPGTEEPAPEGSTSDDLRDRLLPASAFGADATVVGVTLDQLGAAGSGWGGWGGWGGHWGHDDGDHDGWADEVTVEPEACRVALEALQALDDQAGELTLAAQAARTPQTRTVQVLAESPQLTGLQLPVDQLLAGCSSVTATGPWGWSGTVEATPLDVPPLGQQSAGVQVTVDWEGRDSVSVLVGVVLDGSRGLLLAQSAAPDAAAPDAAAFAALLTDAAELAAG